MASRLVILSANNNEFIKYILAVIKFTNKVGIYYDKFWNMNLRFSSDI